MSNISLKLALLCTAATGLVSPALAQTVPDAGMSDPEIVITARRQSEVLRETPATVAVFTAEAIEQTGIKTATDFVTYTPGVTIVSNSAEAGDNQINIRGINSARDAESSVALIVDGILKTNTAVLNQDQGTVRQIEILKGPQGALYGRNAAAGAIVMTTATPGDKLEGAIKLSGGNNNSYTAAAHISTPLSDSVGLLVSGDYLTTDGFFRNRFLDNRAIVDDREAWNINGRLTADVGDATNLDFKVRVGELNGASINFNPSFALPSFAEGFSTPAYYENVNDHKFLYDSNIRPENHQETFETSLKLEHDFGPVLLTAWGLYSNVKNYLTADGTSGDFGRYAEEESCIDTTADAVNYQPGGYPANPPSIFLGFFNLYGAYSPTTCDGTQYQQRDQKDVSFEVRLSSNTPGNALSWQFGTYYLHVDRETAVSLGADRGEGILKSPYNGPDSINPTSQLYWDSFKTDVYAGFGSLDYKFSDVLKGTFAIRYDREERSVHNLAPAVFDPYTGDPINPGQTVVDDEVQPIADKSKTFEQIQPKISLSFAPSREFAAFANWGIGFKSGGFNNQGSNALVETNFNNEVIDAQLTINDQFGKEKSSAFEVGVKGALFGGVVNYELSGFYTKVNDMQFFEFLVGGFGLLRVVSNIDRVDIKGFETSLSAKIIPGWTVFGSFNMTDSEIKKNNSRPDTVGNKSPYTSDYTLNIGSQFKQGLTDDMDLVVRADWRRVGPTWFHTVQNQERPTIWEGIFEGLGTANFDQTKRAAYDVVNLRVGIEGETWRVTGFANNLLNKKYLEEVIPAAEFGGSFLSPGARRAYGVELSYKF